jgi:hypothetical protein
MTKCLLKQNVFSSSLRGSVNLEPALFMNLFVRSARAVERRSADAFKTQEKREGDGC